MRYVGRRHFLADANPMRSLALISPLTPGHTRTAGTQAAMALRLRANDLLASTEFYQAACVGLGRANRAHLSCRAGLKRDAMLLINAGRARMRVAQRALAAQEAIIAAMTEAEAAGPVAQPRLVHAPAANPTARAAFKKQFGAAPALAQAA